MLPPGDDEAEDGRLARRITAAATGGARDEAAEAALCRRLAPRLLGYGRRHLRDAAAAADLVQDVLLLVIEKLRAGAVDEPERLASFALGACRLVASDRRRGEARRRELLEAAAPWIAAAAEDAARGAQATHAIDLARLAGCLERLPARERAVVVASFFADEPTESIARAVSATPGHVRVLRHRALKALHDCLGGAPT